MISLQQLFGGDADVLRESNFQMLLLANLIGPLSIALLSPVIDSMIEPMGTTAANIGLLISFFTAPAIVMIPVAGVLADRFGRKLVLVVALVLFGSAGTAIAFTTDFRVALALRFVQGVAFGGLTPIIITSVGDFYNGSKEATGQGLRFMGAGLSQTAFPLLAGVLVVIAWQYPFFLYALALPIAVVVNYWLDEPTDGEPSPVHSDDASGSYRRELFGLLRRRRVSALVVSRVLPQAVWTAFLTYNSIIVVRVIGGSPPEAGFLVGIGSFVYAMAASQAGRVTRIFDSRFYPLLVGNVCLSVGFVGLLFAPGLLGATVAVVVEGIGFGLLMALYRSIITGLAFESHRAGLVSLAEGGGQVGATLAPVVMGSTIALLSVEFGFTTALRVAGITVAVAGGGGSIVALVVGKASPPTPAEQYPNGEV